MVTLLLIIIYIAFISLGLPDAMLGSAWPQISTDLGVNLSSAGLISMTISAGTIVSSLLSGKIIDKLGTGKVTAISVAMTAVALLGFSFSNGYFWLILMAIPLGLGAGSVDTALNKQSGLLGISGVSSDSRDIEDGINKGNDRCLLAQKMYVRRIIDYIAKYLGKF